MDSVEISSGGRVSYCHSSSTSAVSLCSRTHSSSLPQAMTEVGVVAIVGHFMLYFIFQVLAAIRLLYEHVLFQLDSMESEIIIVTTLAQEITRSGWRGTNCMMKIVRQIHLRCLDQDTFELPQVSFYEPGFDYAFN